MNCHTNRFGFGGELIVNDEMDDVEYWAKDKAKELIKRIVNMRAGSLNEMMKDYERETLIYATAHRTKVVYAVVWTEGGIVPKMMTLRFTDRTAAEEARNQLEAHGKYHPVVDPFHFGRILDIPEDEWLQMPDLGLKDLYTVYRETMKEAQ